MTSNDDRQTKTQRQLTPTHILERAIDQLPPDERGRAREALGELKDCAKEAERHRRSDENKPPDQWEAPESVDQIIDDLKAANERYDELHPPEEEIERPYDECIAALQTGEGDPDDPDIDLEETRENAQEILDIGYTRKLAACADDTIALCEEVERLRSQIDDVRQVCEQLDRDDRGEGFAKGALESILGLEDDDE